MSSPLWSLWDLMQAFEYGQLSNSITGLTNFAHHNDKTRSGGAVLVGDSHKVQCAQIDLICAELEQIEFVAALSSAYELKRIIHGEVSELPAEKHQEMHSRNISPESLVYYNPLALSRFITVASELAGRFRDEAKARKAFLMAPSAEALYTQATPLFGPIVEKSFPDAAEDISEAGKCLALSRYTACVFHLMRAVEIGVGALARELGATTVNLNGEVLPWGVLLSNLKGKIDALPRGANQDEWHQAHALLHSVNRAWRTKTAHPKATYTSEEAETAFRQAKSFLQFMAERIA